MKKILIVVIVAIAFLTQACGTVVHGSKQDLSISTNPPGAKVTVGTQMCKTPCTLHVSRKAEKITIRKDSYDRAYELSKKFNGWSVILGNILWLLPGVVVDVFSGGAYTIEPVNIELEEK